MLISKLILGDPAVVTWVYHLGVFQMRNEKNEKMKSVNRKDNNPFHKSFKDEHKKAQRQ